MKNPFKKKLNLEKIYTENKEFFESMLVREFVGYIPKNMEEPVLKIFSEHAELMQRWVMWQSWYINKKCLHDPLKLTRYDGMMVYLKVLFLMAESNKKPVVKNEVTTEVKEKEKPWVEVALDGLNDFISSIKENESNKGDKNAEDEVE